MHVEATQGSSPPDGRGRGAGGAVFPYSPKTWAGKGATIALLCLETKPKKSHCSKVGSVVCFIYIWEEIFLYHIFPVQGHFGGSHVLATVDNAAVHIGVHMSF